jgi:molecular chaperone IbpA
MRNFDFSPLYRSTIGFDRLFDMLDSASRVETLNNWPPYNIERLAEDRYRITMAVAGFSADEINIVAQGNALAVTGQKKAEEDGTQYLHRGIAARAFKQSFDLADHVKVASAGLENGLLTIDLVREIPEAMKPRRIDIRSADGAKESKQVEHAKAA